MPVLMNTLVTQCSNSGVCPSFWPHPPPISIVDYGQALNVTHYQMTKNLKFHSVSSYSRAPSRGPVLYRILHFFFFWITGVIRSESVNKGLIPHLCFIENFKVVVCN